MSDYRDWVIKQLTTRIGFNTEHAEDAYERLSRDPSVLTDFVHYLSTGEYTNKDGQDSVLGHTPQELVSKYGLEPIGAYLMLSELSVDPIKAEGYLNQIRTEGYTKREISETGSKSYSLVKIETDEKEGFYPICPKCREEAEWIDEYERWYCQDCEKYLEQEEGSKYMCKSCGNDLTWIEQYQRWYCYSCQTYA